MTGKRKRIIVYLLAVVFVLGNQKQVLKAEAEWPQGVDIVSPSAMVMEVDTGTVLYEKNADEIHYPASITKIMTAYLAVENCSLDEIVTFSADAVFHNEGATSHIARDLDEQMTMEQCLYAVLLKSANECAYAVAEHVGQKLGGDYQTFIDLMNRTAEDLGCRNTHFNNPNGLPDENHWTSAHDMALIASAAYKNDTFRQIVGTKTYEIPPTNKHVDPTPLSNDHQMLYPSKTGKYLYEYCTGGKTGFTDDAGNTLVTYAEKDGLTLVCVILHSTNPQHYIDTTALLNDCFEQFQKVNVAQNDTKISSETLKSNGILEKNQEFVSVDPQAEVVIPKTASLDELQISKSEESEDGDSITVEYIYGGHVAGKAQITAQTLIEPESENEPETKQNEEGGAKKAKGPDSGKAAALFGLLLLIVIAAKIIYDRKQK